MNDCKIYCRKPFSSASGCNFSFLPLLLEICHFNGAFNLKEIKSSSRYRRVEKFSRISERLSAGKTAERGEAKLSADLNICDVTAVDFCGHLVLHESVDKAFSLRCRLIRDKSAYFAFAEARGSLIKRNLSMR